MSMNITEMLSDLKKQNITLSHDNGKIKIIGPRELVNNELKQKIAACRQEIINTLKQIETVSYREIPKAGVTEDDCYILSQAQKRIYILSRIDEAGTAYNIPAAMKITGKLDMGRLENAFKVLIDRHEALRTSFRMSGGIPVQKIERAVEFRIERSECEEDRIGDRVKEFIIPFVLEKAPLLRVELVRVKNTDVHILLIDIHHIISDGTSMGILVKELAQLYAGMRLLPLKLQYKDYSEWQKEIGRKDEILRQQHYWTEVFKDEIPTLNMPADYKRPQTQSTEGDKIEFELDHETAGALKNLAKSQGATMYMLLLAGYTVLLSKYTGQRDIVVGSPAAGRSHSDLQNIIGMFVNTLAMRNYPDRDKKFVDFLGEVKANALRAYDNQDYQFDDLVEKLDIKRDVSRNPVFDTMFAYQNTGIMYFELEGLKFSPYEIETSTSKFDLILEAMDEEEVIKFSLGYCSKLFKKTTARRIGGHLVNILKYIVKNPEAVLGEIDMLSGEEKNEILFDFNSTGTDYPRGKTIQQLFEEQAGRTPNAAAVLYGSGEITYRELNCKINQLAGLLRQKGVGPDEIVGILVERSCEMMVGILAVLKAGGAYMPIDPEYPESRIRYMLDDSKARILLTLKSLKNNIFDGIQTVYIDERQIYSGDGSNLDIVNTPGNLAYVIYTSGSTGMPKGVMLSHFNVVNTLMDLQRHYPLGSCDRYLLKTTYTFDVSVAELFGWFMGGGSIYILPDKEHRDVSQIINSIREYKITHINFVPSMFNIFLDELLTDKNKKEQIKMLKYIFVAGEAITKNSVEKFFKLDIDVRLENLYGPTEAAIYATRYPIGKIEEEQLSIPIGKPLDNVNVYVVDPGRKLCPVGVPGELCISGSGVARGYLNRAELTAGRFADNPFMNGERMYHTGDLARWLPDGNVEYIGRMDHQVKIRGYRIELDEIEGQLLKLDQIKDAVIIARDDENNNKYLCACIVSDEPVTITEIREKLAESLPEYMIPSHFMRLKELPLTTSGKVDRKALPEAVDYLESGVEYKAPGSGYERLLVDIWEKVLNRKGIGILDDFFNSGGDSIKAIQVVSMLSQQNLKIKMGDIFRHKNIKELAQIVTSGENKAEQGLVTGSVKLTPIQRWFFDTKKKKKEHFYQSVLLKAEIKVNIEALRESFLRLQAYHDALRAHFIDTGNEMCEEICGLDYPFNFRAVNVVSPEHKEAVMEAEIGRLQRNVDITNGPVMNVIVFRTEAEDYIYILIHHLVVDTVSWGILINDMHILYNQFLKNEKYQLPQKTHSVRQWSEELYKYGNSSNFLSEKVYWKGIAGGAIQEIPCDFEHSANTIYDSAVYTFTLEAEQTGLLLTKAVPLFDATAVDILLAALSAALCSWTGNGRHTVMFEGHGREELFDEISVSRTIGWFTSMYPVLLEAPEDGSLSGYVFNTAMSRHNIPNNGIGYGILKYLTDTGNKEDIAWQVEPQISFNYHGQTDLRDDQALFRLEANDYGYNISPENERDFELDFIGSTSNGSMRFSIVYNTKAFLPETIRDIGEAFKRNLLDIAAMCGRQAEVRKNILENRMAHFLKKFDAAGLIVSMQPAGGKPAVYTMGKADLHGNIEMKTDTRFKIGSITKTFVACIILQMEEEGLLQLNDPITDYIPEVLTAYPGADFTDTRIKNLLNHTAGLKDYTKNRQFIDILMSDADKVWTSTELLNYVLGDKDFVPKGRKPWMYSSTGYILLGLIIERITGMSIEEAIQTRICDTLNLKNTSLLCKAEDLANFSHCYVGSEKRDLTYYGLTALGAAGGMVSNAEDMLIWLDALIDCRLIKNKKLLFDYLDVSEYYPDKNKVKMGLGIFSVNGAVGHEGHGPGFQNILYRYKGHNYFVHLNQDKNIKDNIISDAYEIFCNIVNLAE